MRKAAERRRLGTEEAGTVWRLAIAGLGMTIRSGLPLPPAFDAFAVPGTGSAPLALSVERVAAIAEPGALISREGQLSFWGDGGDRSVALEDFEGSRIGCLRGADRWASARIRIRAGADALAVLKTLGEIYFRTALACQERGLVIHAAGVAWEGRGLAFIGRSGRGKSTQASLWERLRGAVVLNDDRPAVTLGAAGPELHGTPWSGSSAKRLALSVPLAALVFLEQAPVNEARLLTRSEAIPLLLPRVFMPYWSEPGMENALATMERMIGRVKIVHLGCRPDPGAVACLERVLELH